MFLECQCADFGSRWLIGEDRKSQGRESYGIFVGLGKPQVIMEFQASVVLPFRNIMWHFSEFHA